jgi:hypothetical protein
MSSFADSLIKKLDIARAEENLSAQHKLSLDIGEQLLNDWSAFLFGEYKKYDDPIRSVEIGLFNASTRGISLGQRWGFVRDIANSMPGSKFSGVFQKSVKYEIAGELVFWFKRLKTVCIENADLSERVNDNFRLVVTERCRGQSPTPVTIQVLFDEAFVPIRNVYAHPQQKNKKTDEIVTWPLSSEYFELINPLLIGALAEVIRDVKSVVDGFHEVEVTVPLGDLSKAVDVDVAGHGISVALAQFPDTEAEETLSLTFTSTFEPYVRLYLRSPPQVSPSMREALVREETKRQSRALLQGLIESLFSSSNTINEPAYLNLRLVADTGGYTEAELDGLIEHFLKSIGRPNEYEVTRHEESSGARWNPWWSLYFTYRQALQKKLPNDRTVLTEISQGFRDDRTSPEYYHKRIWDELGSYITELGSETLDTEESKWVFENNKWQIGRLTGYFWTRVTPAISPLGSGLGVWFGISHVGSGPSVGLGQYRDLISPLLQFEDPQANLYKYLYQRIYHYMPVMAEELDGLEVRVCDLSGLGQGYHSDLEVPYISDLLLVNGHQMIGYRVSEYLERFPEPVPHHFIPELSMTINHDDPSHVDDMVKKALLLFRKIIEDVTNFSIEKGFSLERAQAHQKRYASRVGDLLIKLSQRVLEPEFQKLKRAEQFEAARRYAHELHINSDDFDSWSQGRFEPIRDGVTAEDLEALPLLTPIIHSAITAHSCGLIWKFDPEKRLKKAASDRMFAAYAPVGRHTALCGVSLNQTGDWQAAVRVKGRRDDDEFRECSARWIRTKPGWHMVSWPDGTRDISLNLGKTQCAVGKDGPVLGDLCLVSEQAGELQKALTELLESLNEFLQSDECLTDVSVLGARRRNGVSREDGEDSELASEGHSDTGERIFPLYEVAVLSEPPSSTFAQISSVEIDNQLKLIASIEGPVHRDVVLYRIGDFNGIGRLGSRIQERVAARIETLAAQNEFLLEGGVIRNSNQSHRPRDRTHRPYRETNPSLLAPEELEMAREQMGVPAVSKAVWRALGVPVGSRLRDGST